jgi:uncharacterized protein YecT (DUF1311 family)
MFRLFASIVLLLLPVPGAGLASQSRQDGSGFSIAPDSTGCLSGRWCLSVLVRDAPTAEPLSGALVSVGGCASLVTDASGRVQILCTADAVGHIQVRAIGYRPAIASFDARPGRSYVGTATLVDAGAVLHVDPVPPLPCEEWSTVADQRRCFDYELARADTLLATTLDSARLAVSSTTLLDSAQHQWRAFVNVQCRLEATRDRPDETAILGELRCRLWRTRQRVYELQGLTGRFRAH